MCDRDAPKKIMSIRECEGDDELLGVAGASFKVSFMLLLGLMVLLYAGAEIVETSRFRYPVCTYLYHRVQV